MKARGVGRRIQWWTGRGGVWHGVTKQDARLTLCAQQSACVCVWWGKAECVLPTRFWFHMGSGCTGCGRELVEAARRCWEVPWERVSWPPPALCGQWGCRGCPGLSAWHLPWLPCTVTRANEMLSVGQVGKRSRASCNLMSPGCKVGLEQAFCRCAPISSSRLCLKWGDLGVPGLCIPVVLLHQLTPSCCTGAVGQRPLAAGAVQDGKPHAAAWLRPGDCRAACGELGPRAPLRELPTASWQQPVGPPSSLPWPTGPAGEGWRQTALLNREGKALRWVFQCLLCWLCAVCSLVPRLACSAPSEIGPLLLGSGPLSCFLLGLFSTLVISSPTLVLGLFVKALLCCRLQCVHGTFRLSPFPLLILSFT